MSPFNAFTFIQGLETLPLRMQRHCENAEKVSKYLSSHKKIQKVIYPSIMSGIHKDRCDKYMTGGSGALLGFELKDGEDAGRKFIDNLKLLYHVANIGDARSLAIHPASTTHRQLTEEQLKAAGAGPEVIRISIGIETVEDVIDDLDHALSSLKTAQAAE